MTNLVFIIKADGRVMTPLNFDTSFARIIKFRCHQHPDQRRVSRNFTCGDCETDIFKLPLIIVI